MDEPQTDEQTEPQRDPLEDDALREDEEHPEADDGERGADDDEPQPDEDAQPDADADEAQARAIQNERDLLKRDSRLSAEHERHAKRLGEIMGDDAGDLIPCPVCMDGIDGYVFLPEVQQLSDEAISRIRQVIGLPDYSTFRQAPDAHACPDCDGLGEVVTGSHVPGYETKTCGLCMKKGWVGTGEAQANGHVPPVEDAPVTGPTVYATNEDDPEVRHLRERGFTVIPPMAVPAG